MEMGDQNESNQDVREIFSDDLISDFDWDFSKIFLTLQNEIRITFSSLYLSGKNQVFQTSHRLWNVSLIFNNKY